MLGLGNVLLGDEGVGVHVAQRLEQMELPAGIEAIDGGTAPAAALAVAGKVARLIIVDAVDVKGRAGEVYRLTPEEVVQSGPGISLHEPSLERLQQTLGEWGWLPEELVILGVAPGSIRWGTELSAELAAKLEHIVQAVLDVASEPLREGAEHNDRQ